MKRFLFSIILMSLLLPAATFAQKSKKKKKTPASTEAAAPLKALDPELEKSPVFSKIFTGFALFDPAQGKMLYEYNSDKYFTPASNTKLFTFYTSLLILGDSIPALQYSKQGDLMVFWGTGDPSFLHPDLQPNPAVFDFLKNRPEELFFCPVNFKDERYGSGWMWSDFPYSYQAEKTPFPAYSNVAHFRRDSSTKEVRVLPAFLKNTLRPDPRLNEDDLMGRAEYDNQFTFNTAVEKGKYFEYHVPYRYTPEFLAVMLADTLKRPVHVLNANLQPPQDAGVIYSLRADSLYKLMLQESDNFIAEQLLLLCSWQKFGVMNTEQIIEYSKKYFLNDLPDDPKWVDGSGLSRYDLFTPRSMVKLLYKIYQVVPRERLFGLLPAGGISGTIKTNYRNGAEPYVFAKTGTLRNNHCLSGYLLTKSGKVLIFSFMNNNFVSSTVQLKKEMERVLRQVKEGM